MGMEIAMQWYENEGLFFDETSIMKEAHPQFKFDSENKNIILKGELKTNRGNYYKLKLVYPENFPRDEPDIYIEGARINRNTYNVLPWFSRASAHMFSESLICWNDRKRSGTWDPDKSTGVVAINAVAVWLFSYECYVFDNEKEWLGSTHIH